MTAQQNGLRFDIYERVHLSEGLLGIKELEQLELVPHIQVLPLGQQAILRGNLLLTGSYVDEHGRAEQTLEHLIPVEITLPMNRVNRVEDISVEIEDFDVDLLSTRSLNVTGVLSLNGLEVVSSPEIDTWKQDEEEIVFVHEAGESLQQQPERPTNAFEAGFAGQQQFGDITPVPSEADRQNKTRNLEGLAEPERTRSRSEPAEPNQAQPRPEAEEPAQTKPRPEPAEPAAVSHIDASPETEVEPVPESVPVMASDGGDEDEEPALAASAGMQEPKELKIEITGKQDDFEGAAPVVKSYGLTSLLGHSASPKPEKRMQDEAEAAAVAAKTAASDKVEWKNLLLSAREEQQFKRVRVCIVQKDDTLESIAKRYEISAREIALHNRLGDNDVSAGQIVFIPR